MDVGSSRPGRGSRERWALDTLLARVRPVRRAEIVHFRRQGFVAVARQVVPGTAIAPVRELLDALFAAAADLPPPWVHDLAVDPQSGVVPEIVNAAHVEPRLLRTRAYARARRAARQLLGGPVRLSFDHAIFKPPRSGADTALHQDLAFVPSWDVPTATIWLALVDVTATNGCMRFLEKTPAGLVEHRQVGRDGLGAVGLDVAQAQPFPVPAGGFTVHNQRAVHGSGRNDSDDLRAVWILKFDRDDRSWRRRTWERALERQGVVVPWRFEELRRTMAQAQIAMTRPPVWVAGFADGGYEAGSPNEVPSAEARK